MTQTKDAEDIIGSHVMWSMGAGLMPVPLFDIAAVTAVQIDMLKQLADHYDADFSNSSGKTFVSALTGSTLARIGASAIKAVPGIGTVIGGLSMSVMSGATTYAIGQVAANHFASHGRLGDVDDDTRREYEDAFQRGKRVASDMKKDERGGVYDQLERLGKLREQGVVTEEEFEAQKRKLLDRL